MVCRIPLSKVLHPYDKYIIKSTTQADSAAIILCGSRTVAVLDLYMLSRKGFKQQGPIKDMKN